MNDAACVVFLNLIRLTVRMMPIFICLEPKTKDRVNIAAVSVYLWVIMVSAESLFHLTSRQFFVVQSVFSCLFFLVLLIFFEGSLLKKAFLYCSAWLFSLLSVSLDELAVWLLRGRLDVSYAQISMVVSLVSACGCGVFIWFWMRERVNRLFDQISLKSSTLLLTYPAVSLILLCIGTGTIFSTGSLRQRGLEDVLFFVALCAMILVIYIMLLGNILEILDRRKTEEELLFARQLIGKQREHYNQTLEHMEQVRIIRHDFRHHIHALLHMEKEEQTRYLLNLQKELDMAAEEVYCQNQAVNGLLQEYGARARQEQVDFSAKMDLSAHVPVDDLTLCIVLGNLLENALEACRRMKKPGFIRVRGRWLDDHLMMMVENSYKGQIRERSGRILSSKKDGGLGMLSIRRILNQPGDEFEVNFDEGTFTAMVKIADRTIR